MGSLDCNLQLKTQDDWKGLLKMTDSGQNFPLCYQGIAKHKGFFLPCNIHTDVISGTKLGGFFLFISREPAESTFWKH